MPRTRYNNLDNVTTDKTLKQFKQWREERRSKKKDYSYVIPHSPPDLDYLRQNRRDTTVTWIGHSTFLIQYLGLNIVTDPVWAWRMGLTRRLTAPGIPIEDVPDVDVILISHSHYDHMHIASIRRLYGSDTQLLVPAGLGAKMIRKGFRRTRELSWWEDLRVGDAKITFVPTQHWTRRTPFDTNTSHWGGFVLEPAVSGQGGHERDGREQGGHEQGGHEQGGHERDGRELGGHELGGHELGRHEQDGRELGGHEQGGHEQGGHERDGREQGGHEQGGHEPDGHEQGRQKPQVIYFAGDSGYFRGFREIGERFNIDVALLPIGAYEPEWFMTSQHTTPEEALQAFVDVKGKLMIPMHYGTFRLADDTAREALDRLEADRKRRGIPAETVRILHHGETFRLPERES